MLSIADAVAVNAGKSRKMFRMHKAARKIAHRFDNQVAEQWLRALTRYQSGISDRALRKALTSGSMKALDKAVGSSHFGQLMKGLESPILRTVHTAGDASAKTLTAAGFNLEFNAVHPNVVEFARDRAGAKLASDVTKDVREAVRVVVATGTQQGLTVVQQARAIRETVGLPPNWASAPLNLADDIRNGREAAATSRRLSATDKAQIRRRMKEGTVTDDFVSKMQKRYTDSLTNRRALNIARTETTRAANFGQTQSWQQAIDEGTLPSDSRRFWLVTPDERLSPEHASIPGMNPNGRAMNEPFKTTEGQYMYPPSRTNCRCGVGLGVGTGAAKAKKTKKAATMPKPGGTAAKAKKAKKTTTVPKPEGAAEEAAIREKAARKVKEAAERAAKTKTTRKAAKPAQTPSRPKPRPREAVPEDTRLGRMDGATWEAHQYAQEMYTDEQILAVRDMLARSMDDLRAVGIDDLADAEGRKLLFNLRGRRGAFYKYASFEGTPSHYRINIDGMLSKSPHEVARFQRAAEVRGWTTAGAQPKRWAVHEVGHALQFRTMQQTRSAAEFTKFTGKVHHHTKATRAVARRVSNYATENVEEFVAETFTGLVKGRVYDAEVLWLYRQRGGYIASKWKALFAKVPKTRKAARKAKKEAAERAAKAKAAREAADREAKEALERAAREKAQREAAEKAAREKAEREAREKAARELQKAKDPFKPEAGFVQGDKLRAGLEKDFAALDIDDSAREAFSKYFDIEDALYADINRLLRKGINVGGRDLPFGKNKLGGITMKLDSTIARTQLGRKSVLWRGGSLPKGLKVGDTITDKGFASTSVDKKVAERFFLDQDDAVILRIGTEAEQQGMWMNRVLKGTEGYVDEGEVLLQRGTRFVVQRDQTMSIREYTAAFGEVDESLRELGEQIRVVDLMAIP